jgi:hypothetical protein
MCQPYDYEAISTPRADAILKQLAEFKQTVRHYRLAQRHCDLGEPFSHNALMYPVWAVMELGEDE